MIFDPQRNGSSSLVALTEDCDRKSVGTAAPYGRFLKEELTQELVRKLIRCENDRYFWNERGPEMFAMPNVAACWNKKFANTETCTGLGGEGYSRLYIFGRVYLAHRFIWFYHYGVWPAGEIDHINGDRRDNRLCNLRVVPHCENSRNKRRSVKNTSGTTGVYWHRNISKWQARIGVDGKDINLGFFLTKEAAARARKEGEAKFGFHPNHDRPIPARKVTGEHLKAMGLEFIRPDAIASKWRTIHNHKIGK